MATEHSLTLRALAALLAYPDEEQRAALPEIGAALQHARGVDGERRAQLLALVDELGHGELLDAEARYVELFDRGRTTSLNLFEHVHGDGRERGSAMLELRERYAKIGLEQSNHELPDHLPVLLEYLSCCEPDETPALLGECALVLRKLGNTLAKRGSRYAAVPAALLDLAGEEGLDPLAPVPPPEDLDQSWEERPAFEAPTATAHR
ncbi:MAG: nitrate reductase molybdenum cofactor assembly chaperone [Rhodanobacter sp.]|nr:MAG: nitrate reductase molybdenum cofactor assembly chaperone [Rhodanobacter sp.]TAM08232.1 MAG: nitrate reductase molybdenum cofactor assembly chaperone [Rhodanobacter sp.]